MKFGKLGIFAVLIAVGCASHRPDYSADSQNWKEDFQLPSEDPAYSLFLIGDAGVPQTLTGTTSLVMLEEKLRETEGRQGVVFLGDNVYPKGVPHEGHKDYDAEVSKLKSQVDILKGYEGDVVFLPGNHDWAYGKESLGREDDLVEEWVGEKKIFLPDWGCGGPEDKDLTEDVAMLIIDSQWYLEDWDEQRDFNRGCEASSRSEFMRLFKDELSKLKDKTVLVAMHHPIHSAGPHGGHYSLKHEIFPFTEMWRPVYFPMPVLAGLLRRNLGIDQDITNPRYRNLVQDLKKVTGNYDNVIFVSGHEHNLQYIRDEDHPYIVSGAGSKRSVGRAGGIAKYTSGQGGFVEMQFFRNGAVWALFWNALTSELDFATEVFPRDTLKDYDFSIYEEKPDSITTSIYDKERYPGDFARALWGPLNREMYFDSVTVPVFYLEDQPDNLRVKRIGGGHQTNSIHLENDLGHQYVLRSIRKDGSRVLGGNFKGTFVVPMLEDVFTYIHPFGPFILPPLADSARLYRTNPELVYLPKQPGLRELNEGFANDLYMFEERPDDDGSHVASFGRPEKIVGTDDLMEDLEESYKNILDVDWMMRARIFDFMIGDWDRHQDNWRWSTFPVDSIEGGTLYRAIPRDRDHVFSNFEGFMISVLNRSAPTLRQFQSYSKEIDRMKWYGEFPKFYDRRFIGPVPWHIWEQEARYIQEHVSDSLIRYAVSQLPEPAFEHSGEELIEIMKYRKEHLVEISREYYELLAKSVDVIGTEDDDIFLVKRLSADSTEVTHYVEDEGERHLRYRRVFLTDETDEVRIYGMEGDDHYILSGEAGDGILIRVIGGYGDDKVEDDSRVKGLFKKTKVYDYPGGMDYVKGPETALKLSRRYDVNNYEFMDFHRDYSMFLPDFEYNIDFGFVAGLNFVHYGYGYKKKPQASVQKINGNYAFGNKSFELRYEGLFNNAFNYWGFSVEALFRSPRYTFNYFGEGNETRKVPGVSRLYNQVRQHEIRLGAGVRRPFKSDAGYFDIKGFYSRSQIEDSKGRFISQQVHENGATDAIFDLVQLGGLETEFVYDTRDITWAPRRGLLVDFGLRHSENLERSQRTTSLRGEITFYQRLDVEGDILWATQVGSEHLLGDYLFFQSAYVGGPENLRGFRKGRFRGRTSFWNLNDLRFDFGQVHNWILPFSPGIFLSFDHGRVWHDTFDSEQWHYTYGGGIAVKIVDLFAVSGGYHMGDVNGQYLFGLGFDF